MAIRRFFADLGYKLWRYHAATAMLLTKQNPLPNDVAAGVMTGWVTEESSWKVLRGNMKFGRLQGKYTHLRSVRT